MPQSRATRNGRPSLDPPIVNIWLSLFVVTVGSSDSPKAMPFIETSCPSVAFERPKFKDLRAFNFRLFNKRGTKSMIRPTGVDVQLLDPVPIQNQHTGNGTVDFDHPYLSRRHDSSHKVFPCLLIKMHKRWNRRHRRMARAQENFRGRHIVRLFGPSNPGYAANRHSRRSTTYAGHTQLVV